MVEHEMLLDTDTIKAAVAGEKWAKDTIISFFISGFIVTAPFL